MRRNGLKHFKKQNIPIFEVDRIETIKSKEDDVRRASPTI